MHFRGRTEAVEAPASRSLAPAVRVLLAADAVLFLALAATGAWLSFRYRPEPAPPFSSPRQHENLVRLVHTWTSSVFGMVTLILAVISVVAAVAAGRRRWTMVATAVAAAVASLALSYTGYLLPWDQLAVRAASGPAHFGGFWGPVFDRNVLFFLTDRVEVSRATMRNGFLLHILVLPVVAVALALVLVRATRAR